MSLSHIPCRGISDVASMLGVTLRTVRFYEEKGLVSPERWPGGKRVYSPADVARLTEIVRLRACDFSLREVREFLTADHDRRMALLYSAHNRARDRALAADQAGNDCLRMIEEQSRQEAAE